MVREITRKANCGKKHQSIHFVITTAAIDWEVA